MAKDCPDCTGATSCVKHHPIHSRLRAEEEKQAKLQAEIDRLEALDEHTDNARTALKLALDPDRSTGKRQEHLARVVVDLRDAFSPGEFRHVLRRHWQETLTYTNPISGKFELTLVRGPAGSGKTTYAEAVAHGLDLPLDCLVAADDFFTDEAGNYDFKPWKIGEAHSWCRGKVRELMREGRDHVIVHNTFVAKWEMDDYIALAEDASYEVKIFRCSGEWESVHNVPAEIVQRMRDNMEDVAGETMVVVS